MSTQSVPRQFPIAVGSSTRPQPGPIALDQPRPAASVEFPKVYQPQVVLRLLAALGFGNPFHLHAELDVLPDSQPGK